MGDPLTPWRSWFHCTGSTYGTWLPGDPRGWRSQRHKTHVEGDYQTPPPAGTFNRLHRRSKRLLKHAPVILTPPQRRIACDAWAEALTYHTVTFEEIGIGGMHWHLLGCFPNREPRPLIGRAKTWSNRKLRQAGVPVEGSAWAEKCQCLPITDPRHFRNAANYIRKHAREGAAVWSLIRTQAT